LSAKEQPRSATSYESVAGAFLRWSQALRSGDERRTRLEARVLADEARLFSRTHPLPLPTAESRRLRISAGRDGLGRIG
jgi:hypothetical protein